MRAHFVHKIEEKKNRRRTWQAVRGTLFCLQRTERGGRKEGRMCKLAVYVKKRGHPWPLPGILILLAMMLWPVSTAAQEKTARKPASMLGEVTIDRFRELDWRPEDGFFRSPGPVRITLLDAITGEKTIISADDAEGSPESEIKVRGKLRLERPEGILSGHTLTYHPREGTGSVLEAGGEVMGLLLRGQKVEILAHQMLRASHASFTTCAKEHADYHITAREVSISTNRQVDAREVTLWIGGTRLFTIPSLRRSFRRTVENPFSTPGYSKENGIQFHIHSDVISEPSTSLNYDFQLSLRRIPQGIIGFEQDIGPTKIDSEPPRARGLALTEPLRTALESHPALSRVAQEEMDTSRRSTFYVALSARTFVYNRQRTDLRVSRLPEIGVSFRNLLNRTKIYGATPDERLRVPSAFGSGFFTPANWLLNAEASAAFIQERPTHAETTRLGMRLEATSPLFSLMPYTFVRYGGTTWLNKYGDGHSYAILSPEVEIDLLPRPNTLLSAAYRFQQDFGQTPFLFDRLDVRHELRLRYGFLGAHWGYDVEVKYDLERSRAYDSSFSFRRRLDCMEIGLGYRTRSQSLNLIFNLLPGSIQRISDKSYAKIP